MSSKSRKPAEQADEKLIEEIKKTTIISLVNDDDLYARLALKGGNAIKLIHNMNFRASSDIDFSIEGDVDELTKQKILSSIETGFAEKDYFAFEIKFIEKPKTIEDELKSFWGGYSVEFKLISAQRANQLQSNHEQMRREAIMLGTGNKFTIDISLHEYTETKKVFEINNYSVFAYTLEMIVIEKLRAICQQMEDYREIINRKSSPRARARDFVDIENIITNPKSEIDLSKSHCLSLTKEIFNAKRVPLELIGKIETTRDFHIHDYQQVVSTMTENIKNNDFDYYFKFVVNEVQKLKSLWDK